MELGVQLMQDLIAPVEAKHVLWHYGELPGALEPGSFTKQLITTIDAADPRNRYRLSLGFRGYVAAVALIKDTNDGVVQLREAAGITLCPMCSGTGMRNQNPPVMVGGQPRYLVSCERCSGHGAV